MSVSLLDAQHKRLFSLAHNLQDAMSAGHGRVVLVRYLNELVEYAKTHITEEDLLLIGHDYPGLPVHRAQHAALIRQIADIQERFSSRNAVMNIELMDSIRGRITDHILQTDMRYADFFNRLGVY